MNSKAAMPRNFKLMEEYDNKGNHGNISYGLVNDDDIFMKEWEGVIMHCNNNEPDIYGSITRFNIKTGDNYPEEPPIITLLETESNRITNLFKNNNPLNSKKAPLKYWTMDSTIASILKDISNSNN